MSKDDMHVVMYKVLEYLYACMKAGVEPNVFKAREIADVNDRYFYSVLGDMQEHGLIAGELHHEMNGAVVLAVSMRITSDGVEYLNENSSMAKVRAVIGAMIEPAIAAAVAATQLL